MYRTGLPLGLLCHKTDVTVIVVSDTAFPDDGPSTAVAEVSGRLYRRGSRKVRHFWASLHGTSSSDIVPAGACLVPALSLV